MLPVTLPVRLPVTLPVSGPENPVFAVMFVPVMAEGVVPPITIPLTVPPVRTALLEDKLLLAVTVPGAVIVPVVIDEGLVPSSTIVEEAFSVKRRLSVTLTANSP
jgi:hypothetical protein